MQLGIITADGKNQFFDAAGNMKSMSEIAGILNKSLSGLSDEQKNQALSTIFGSDAMRAAAALAGFTDKEFLDLKATMKNVDAETAAATRMNTLGGQIEILRGIVDQIATDIGTAFLPQMKGAATVLTELATAFQEHWPEIQDIVTQATDQIAEDSQRLIDSLNKVGGWFSGEGSQAENDWSRFWLGLLKITTDVVTGTVGNIANLIESFAALGETMKAISTGDWGAAAAQAGRGAELLKQLYSFTNPLGMLFDAYQKNQQGRANGGPVSGGQSYLVGERGPELFTPGSSGYITPNGAASRMDIYVHGESSLPNDRMKLRELARALQQEISFTGAVMVN